MSPRPKSSKRSAPGAKAQVRAVAPESVLVVEAEPGLRERWLRALRREHALVEGAAGAEHARPLLERCRFDALVVGLPRRGQALLDWACAARDAAHVRRLVVVAPERTADLAVSALRGGADEYLRRDSEDADILRAVRDLLAGPSARGGGAATDGAELLGNTAAMLALRAELERIAPRAVSVLVVGEAGSGKETVARYLHRLSGRSGRFTMLGCGALDAATFERDFPVGGHTGVLVSAAGGTLFLDNVGELGLDAQARLLRGLDEQPSWRGLADDMSVRIVAGAGPDIAARRGDGRFREDLYYRLNVVTVRVPPLRERRADVPLLARFHARQVAAQAGLEPPEFTVRELDAVAAHDWPGNVRQLRNAVEHCVLTGRPLLECLHAGEGAGEAPGAYPLSWSLRQVEDAHIARVLGSVAGNKSEAARRLGVSRKTLERRFRSGGQTDE